MIATWHPPFREGAAPAEELLVSFNRGRAVRVLVCPAWFDEANKLRRFTIEVMRRLDAAGIDSLLPDLPGCNESLAPLENQTLEGWRSDMTRAAEALGATHVLAIRAGALVAPTGLPGWHYAPQSGPRLLRGMIRARIIAAREEGLAETNDDLMAAGRSEGLMLGGWRIGAEMFRALENAEPVLHDAQRTIEQSALGGPGLWLRAEPDEDAAQADRLAVIIGENLAMSAT
ncbi:hypothetical protein [Porphyrobacter sp. YT40]|uniref:hypothetical protein n=1 Tax=Porphyrobacter sp. YT40 TaxID=2547601 RepID=UPI00114293C8|nr:hypothetical protein [Porphyrobacter sp. YT40]QDH34751.1 hypothetical protein E2E27_10705 [Porphyrobacter sp. YT40]